MSDILTPQGEGATSAPTHLNGSFLPENSKLFWLAVWTGALTVVTLGIYRFWARTRMRRYIWSSIVAEGDSFEYTGTGLEKFLGFLIALVVLAVYLGVLQVVLSFIGFSLWGAISSKPNGPTDILMQLGATYGTGLAVLPLIFFCAIPRTPIHAVAHPLAWPALFNGSRGRGICVARAALFWTVYCDPRRAHAPGDISSGKIHDRSYVVW